MQFLRRYGFASVLLLVFAVQCVHWGGLGYGTDEDGWGIIGSWIVMKDDGMYVPSRNQGNLVAEITYGEVAHWGGPDATGALSVGLSVLALMLFWLLCRQFLDRPRSLLAVAFVASCPYWIYRSVISTDYMVAIPSFLLGMLLYRYGWKLLGILLLAIAGSARLQYAPLGAVFIVAIEWLYRDEESDGRRSLERLVAFVFVQGLFYVPAFISAHLTLAFLNVFMPKEWSPFNMNGLGRAVYKVVYLFGFPTILVLIGAAGGIVASHRVRARRKDDSPRWKVADRDAARKWAVIGGALAATTYIIFLRVPLEPEYLFPLLFLAAAVLAATRLPSLVIFLAAALMVVNGYVRADVIRVKYKNRSPCEGVWAVSASPGFTAEPGVLVRYGDRNLVRTRCLQAQMAHYLSNGGKFNPMIRPVGIAIPEGIVGSDPKDSATPRAVARPDGVGLHPPSNPRPRQARHLATNPQTGMR